MLERFLLTIQGKRLLIDMEDRVLWKETKVVFVFLLNSK